MRRGCCFLVNAAWACLLTAAMGRVAWWMDRIVHTAPGHGHEDFLAAKDLGLEPLCPVDDEGRFTQEAGDAFVGLPVQTAGNKAVLEVRLGARVCPACSGVGTHVARATTGADGCEGTPPHGKVLAPLSIRLAHEATCHHSSDRAVVCEC